MTRRRACIIGLDCLTPQLLFDSFLDALPHFSALIGESLYGRLESCMPPITIPAWVCMATGVDPGVLGLYGFRGRADQDQLTAHDLLTNFREMHHEGDINDAEFRTIKTVLGERIQAES